MKSSSIFNRRRKFSLFVLLFIIAAASFPATIALEEEPATVTDEPPVESVEESTTETPSFEDQLEDLVEELVEEVVEAAEELTGATAEAEAEAAAKKEAELQKAKEEQERIEALEKAAEEAAARATEEVMAAAAAAGIIDDDDDVDDDGSNAKAGIDALQKSVSARLAAISEKVKALAITKQKVKKAAAATLGVWGAATGFGWAMHHFGAEKAAAN